MGHDTAAAAAPAPAPAPVDLDHVEVVDVMQALSDPARIAIVRALADRNEVACGGFELGLALIDDDAPPHGRRAYVGLVTQLRVGTTRLNRLRRAEFDARFPGLLASVLAAGPASA